MKTARCIKSNLKLKKYPNNFNFFTMKNSKPKIFSLLLILMAMFIGYNAFSQVSYNPYVATLMNLVNTDSVKKFERQFSGDTSCIISGVPYTIVSRHYATAGNIQAAQYLLERFQSWGYTPWFQVINSTITNVLCKKIGTKYPNQYVVFCGHYDDMPSGSTAPGADDNASGTVAVLEAARILKNYNFPYTILFALWDEEERGLYGSKAYADTAFAHGDSIIAVLNFDMISYDGNNDGALDVNTNVASTSLANEFAQITALYQPTLVPQVTTSLNGGSDHQSFQNRGYKAILSIEDNSDFTPYYHTVNDKYSTLNIPYFIKMVKAGVAALVTIAGDYKITINHNQLSSGPSTAPRTAVTTIKSSYKIATGTFQPRLYYKVNGGSYAFVTPSYSNLDTFKFTIPGQILGSTVNYYIAAQDSAGSLVATLPSGGSGLNPPGTTAPSTTFSYSVANINIVNIGTGTTAVGWPYYTFYMDSRTDMLYTAAEMINNGGTMGNITKIGFDVTSAASQVMNGFKVKIQNYNQTTISGFVDAGWTTCYDGSYSVAGTGMQYVTLQTPFYWDGVSSLLVEICFNNSSYTSNTSVNGTPATNMNKHNHSDLSSGDGCTQITSVGSTYTARPNISVWFETGTNTPINPSVTPNVFELAQNYPNPFNPVTKINFQVPKQEFVTLRVYDMLGREVALLVNEVKSPGYYTVDFKASNFASGIYTYRMTAGSFDKTMRMVIIK